MFIVLLIKKMIKIIDTYSQINSLFEKGMFIQAKWESLKHVEEKFFEF